MQTIKQELEEIARKMCDEYCKYPEIAHIECLNNGIERDLDETEYLTTHYCEDCPMLRLT